MSDGGQWGDAMREITRLRERVAGMEDVVTMTSEALGRLDRRLVLVEEDAPQPTLRDRFAMAALTGAMAAFFEEGSSWEDFDDMAATCYEVADAMLRAREGK